MKKYFIDSNIFLRLIVKENESQYLACKMLFEAIKKNKFQAVTCNLVLAEIVWVLQSYYHKNRKQVIEALRAIINLRGLEIIRKQDYHLTLNLYERFGVKYIDAAIASIKPVYEGKWPVITYDKDFDKIGVIRKEPEQLWSTSTN